MDLTWLDFIVKLFAIVGGVIALGTFLRSAKVRRAEWLSSLHAKFFEGANYKSIRGILDSDDEDKLSKLRLDITSNQGCSEDFVDFLNFFEFVASLHQLRQIRDEEITMLFDYYLRLLCKHAFVRAYIRENGFEQLDRFLKDCVEPVSK